MGHDIGQGGAAPRVGRAEVLVVLLVVRFGAFVFHVSVGLCLAVWVPCLLLWVPWLFGAGGLPRFALTSVQLTLIIPCVTVRRSL